MKESNSMEHAVRIVTVNFKVFLVDLDQVLHLALAQFTKKFLGTFGWNRRVPARGGD